MPAPHANNEAGETFTLPSSNRLTWRQYRIELGLIFAFWTLLAVLAIGHLVLNHAESSPAEWLNKVSHYYLWAVLTPGIFWLSRRVSLTRAQWPSRVLLHLGLGFLIASLYGGMYHYVYDLLLQSTARRASLLMYWWQELQLGFLAHLPSYFAILAAGFALDYYRRSRMRQIQAARLQRRLAEARLEALRMQIHPHFLFNTLHSISAFVDHDPPAARQIVARLSDFLRRVLEDADHSEVPLRKELLFADDYLAIMQIRLEGHLSVEKDIAPGLEEALVPNLVLQPLVENAVKHGVSKSAGPGRVCISAWREGQQLHLRVSDDGPGLPATGELPTEGVGLENTRHRLNELYGAAGRLSLRSASGITNDSNGLAVTLSLPYHTTDDLSLEAVT